MLYAQSEHTSFSGDSLQPGNHTGRKWLVGAGTALGYGGSFVLLNKAWYKGYARSSFHTFDDSGEWQQMDKIGHAWSAYNMSSATTALWQWAGVQKNTGVMLGSGTALLYLLSIEYLDGRSAQWGWSWADMGADFFGTGLYAAQALAWKAQRVRLKFSAHYRHYETSLLPRADALFGKSLPERLLKDYNAQSYWLSFNIRSFFPRSGWPSWLNLSIGYGADGMFGGYENIAYDKNGNTIFDRRDIRRYRQWYLSPDIDLSKIRTESKLLKTVFSVFNTLKIPAPALSFSNNKFRVKGLVF